MGVGGRGGLSPPGLPLLIDGPVDPGKAPVAAKTRGLCSGELSGRSGVRGCWGAGPCGASSPPPLAVALRGPCVFLLWGDLPNLSYSNSARGYGGAVRRLSIKEIVTWDPSLVCSLGGGERYRLASAMIFRRPVYESSESSHFG